MRKSLLFGCLCLLDTMLSAAVPLPPLQRPNVLFIAIDDLNDWVGCLGGHPQAQTPNIDRLAKRGILFTNAHCQATICVPSRVSVLTGTYPFHNGVYDIPQKMRDAPVVANAVTLPQYFIQHGYHSIGVGKIFHHDDPQSWSEQGPLHGAWPNFPWRGRQTLSGLPLTNLWVFDFGPVDVADNELPDGQIAAWAVSRIRRTPSEPFFLGVGFTGTHLPLLAPRRFHQLYPLDSVKLPPAPMDDLEDLPPMGRKFTRYFDLSPLNHNEIMRRGLWRRAVASYLACISYVDFCVGQVLDALDASAFARNTVVVLWSDHGFHLGEKQHWEKRSLWERSTHVPLIVAQPASTAVKGGRCDRTVGLIDLYPTLVELCGLSAKSGLDGRSLAPLLADPQRDWPHAVLTMQQPGNHAVRTEHWRYIRYANGDEELYDERDDPNEFHNLAAQGRYRPTITQLASSVPAVEAPSGPRLPQNRTEFEFDWTKP